MMKMGSRGGGGEGSIKINVNSRGKAGRVKKNWKLRNEGRKQRRQGET
jgi:hypothetical protein